MSCFRRPSFSLGAHTQKKRNERQPCAMTAMRGWSFHLSGLLSFHFESSSRVSRLPRWPVPIPDPGSGVPPPLILKRLIVPGVMAAAVAPNQSPKLMIQCHNFISYYTNDAPLHVFSRRLRFSRLIPCCCGIVGKWRQRDDAPGESTCSRSSQSRNASVD